MTPPTPRYIISPGTQFSVVFGAREPDDRAVAAPVCLNEAALHATRGTIPAASPPAWTPPFQTPEQMQLRLLSRYYDLLNQNPEFLADLTVLLEDAELAAAWPGPCPPVIRTRIEGLAARWGIPLDDAVADVLHSAMTLQQVRVDHPDDPDIAALYHRLSPEARVSNASPLTGEIVFDCVFAPLVYNPASVSPIAMRAQIRAIAKTFEQHALAQLAAIEARAREAGYVSPLQHRKLTDGEQQTLVRRAYEWWALGYDESTIAERESERLGVEVQESAIHRSIGQWRGYFDNMPRRRPKKR